MARAAKRLALALAVLTVLAVTLLLGQGTSHASDRDLGWLRLTPAQGRIDAAVDAQTQGRCPKGEAVVVSVTGPGIPRSRDVGFIVGNTAISALAPDRSGQLTVPLALTFKDWFSDNAPGVKPKGTYTVSLVCRDRLRASKTYGEYVAQVAIAGGRFRALGAAAAPTAAPQQPAPASPSSSAPAAPGSAAPAPTAAAPSASATAPAAGSAPSASAPATASDPAVVPAAAGTGADDGSGPRLLLLGLAAAAVLAVGAVLLRGRRTPTGQHSGGGRAEP